MVVFASKSHEAEHNRIGLLMLRSLHLIRCGRLSSHLSLHSNSHGARLFASQSASPSDREEELKRARTWIKDFNADTLPKSLYDVSFSRSSGPGGQNVNKVNSKATMKVDLATLLQHVPSVLEASIRASQYCTTRSETVVISSDDSRKQGDNARHCEAKLYDMIVEAGKRAVPGETSDAQRRRVQNL
ncbi:MAG: hypothetical protein M1828_003677 [Chrysothrix sp. TS-e1954]|nr:MAG: hypothetical protein M1828_003677 [Chrysothrix sp. TS-e1954]